MRKTQAEYSAKWRALNPERNKAHQKAYKDKNADREKAYREANKERRRELHRLWKKANPEKVALNERRRRLKKQYGLSLDQYEALSEAQNHQCAICAKHRDLEKSGNLAVDHCHESNFIRGLLCNDCNRNLVSHRNDPEIFLRAAEYVASSRVRKIAA